MKREEARIAAEMEERDQEEARKLLEAAQKRMGSKRLNIVDGAHLDKQQLMTQVGGAGAAAPPQQGTPWLLRPLSRRPFWPRRWQCGA